MENLFEEPDLLGLYCDRRDRGHAEEYAYEITQKYMFNFFLTHMNRLFSATDTPITNTMPEEEKKRLLYLQVASDAEKLELIKKWYTDYKDSIYSSLDSFERAYRHRNDLLNR